MADGVTPTGFVRPRLPEIRATIVESLVTRLRAVGYTDTIETRPDSLIGLLIDTFAERETGLWEQTEAVYYAMYPGSASGAQLDRAVSFTGVNRLAASQSSVYVILYGTEGTVVPALSQIRNSVTQTLWETEAAATIGAGAAGDASIRPIVANSATYTATIDGVARSYTSDGTATLAEILTGLGAAMTASGHTVTNDGAQLRIRANGRESFPLQVTSNLQITRLGTPTIARAMDAGQITAAIGELSMIVTLVPGWDGVSNLQAASIGRLAETDAELRARYKTGVYQLGAATLPAIEANISSRVLGISSVKVFENDDDVTDSAGRPPHSIHVVVEGGLDVDIASAIFQYKAAGIDTHGAVVLDVIDSEGTDHEIRFDRPTPRYIWVKVVVTVMTSGEETFPPDGLSRIRTNILAEGEALGVGRDVIWQRFLQAIHAVGGVASADLKFAVTAAPTPAPASGAYTAANITIADFEVARFDLSRIEVT
jgi:uncharacterized phage protein gp47/JayE